MKIVIATPVYVGDLSRKIEENCRENRNERFDEERYPSGTSLPLIQMIFHLRKRRQNDTQANKLSSQWTGDENFY